VAQSDHVVIELLDALCASWAEHHSASEVGSDPDKIRLLREARDAIDPKSTAIPEGVRSLYNGVFKRDVWDSC
jgi:hypothetical protein